MPGISVIGLQWGDEAKGKLVDILTADCDIVVRYLGGANAGHTVVHGDKTYKLHHLPSGILNPETSNVVTGGVVINPKTLLEEIDGVSSQGVNIDGRLHLSDRAHVVMPWHFVEDKILNSKTGSEDIGTTMRGIGPCYRDKVGRSFAIRLGDMYRSDFKDRLKHIVEHKKMSLAGFNADVESLDLDADSIFDEYSAYAEKLGAMVCDTNDLLLDAVEQNKRLLFEGAQGALLDVDHGTYPYVTSSNSSGVGITGGSGVPPKWIDKILGVAKCYSTRVGGGPFPTELEDETGEHIRKMGNEFGTTTGRPRRCGWFDAVAVRYTSRLSGIDGLAMTMLDVLSEMDEIQICTAYKIDGVETTQLPSHADDLRKVVPVYESMPGWKVDVTTIRDYDELPQNAKNYLDRLSELVGVPVEVVSVGPDRDQTIPVGNLIASRA